MNEYKNSIESIIDFAWASGADLFWVNKTKEELKSLRAKNKEMAKEAALSNQFAIDEMRLQIKITKELQDFKDSILDSAWVLLDDKGNITEISMIKNHSSMIPVFIGRKNG